MSRRVEIEKTAEREAWLAWMVSTDRHHPDCYLDAQQEELFAAWKAARATLPALPNHVAPEHQAEVERMCDEATARFMADCRDAKRYRWLRNRGEHFNPDGPAKESPWAVLGINHTDAYPASGDRLDEAVDEAMRVDAACVTEVSRHG
jgi:hypothetical protein